MDSLCPGVGIVCVGIDEQADVGDMASGHVVAGFLAAQANVRGQRARVVSAGWETFCGKDTVLRAFGRFECNHVSCAASGWGRGSSSKLSVGVANGKRAVVVRSIHRKAILSP